MHELWEGSMHQFKALGHTSLLPETPAWQQPMGSEPGVTVFYLNPAFLWREKDCWSVLLVFHSSVIKSSNKRWWFFSLQPLFKCHTLFTHGHLHPVGPNFSGAYEMPPFLKKGFPEFFSTRLKLSHCLIFISFVSSTIYHIFPSCCGMSVYYLHV